jgi:lipopolysaccharide/colanic/teichoic acid biosynthesis glycosyltransferase
MSDPTPTYRGKRTVDIVVLLLVAIPLGALGIVIAVAVRLSSPGPVLFRQDRIGAGGNAFECLKFRTMVDGDNPLIPDQSRVTGVGRWLRRFSLDELPQLVNVARGDMSIVGPRPMLAFQAGRCAPDQHRRFAVRPGLTGLAQVSGRNALPWSDRIALDIEYVENQSFWLDLGIVARTAGAVIAGNGVEGHPIDDPFVATGLGVSSAPATGTGIGDGRSPSHHG